MKRFKDNKDGTILDNQTGLIWLKNTSMLGQSTWEQAMKACASLKSGGDLCDGSKKGDWRLPSRFELESLLDLSQSNPALPAGHPFECVQSGYYWSGTTYAANTGYAWLVGLINGYVYYDSKTSTNYVWPVRGKKGRKV